MEMKLFGRALVVRGECPYCDHEENYSGDYCSTYTCSRCKSEFNVEEFLGRD